MTNPYHAPGADLSKGDAGAAVYDPELFAVNGRIGRLRYMAYSVVLGLLSFLALVVVGAVIGVVMAVTKSNSGVVLAALLGYIPVLAVTFILAKRRLNDMGHSGWLSLLLMVPLVGLFVWLWLMIGAGDPDANKYGPPPSENTTLVIVGACIMPLLLVAMIGIMAAVAVPAYQQYLEKAKAAQQRQAPAPDQYQQ